MGSSSPSSFARTDAESKEQETKATREEGATKEGEGEGEGEEKKAGVEA
jgi:hypothetical protein